MRSFIPLPTHGVQKSFADHPLYRLENNGCVVLYVMSAPVCAFDINTRMLAPVRISPSIFAFVRRRMYAFAIEMGLPMEPYIADLDTVIRRMNRYMEHRYLSFNYLTEEEKEYLKERSGTGGTKKRVQPA